MELPLVTYQQAVILRYLGFDWNVYYFFTKKGKPFYDYKRPCNYNINHGNHIRYSRPYVAHALKWLRDMHGIFCSVSEDFLKYHSSFEESESHNLNYIIETILLEPFLIEQL